ncbi:hypothetical protein PCK1_001397 [Pneumocystis canis]|nr:hypothetical protein PCK1_001397 [Pneumocystis canis]
MSNQYYEENQQISSGYIAGQYNNQGSSLKNRGYNSETKQSFQQDPLPIYQQEIRMPKEDTPIHSFWSQSDGEFMQDKQKIETHSEIELNNKELNIKLKCDEEILPTPINTAAITKHKARKQKYSKGKLSQAGLKNTPRNRKHDSEDEDEDYNMEGTKTKSGRKIHRPTQFNPAAKTPSKRRGPGRRSAQDSHFCIVCQRGHSPSSNRIVFCDGCNFPYHQLCHIPVIDDLVINLSDSEWLCFTCNKKRAKRTLLTGATGASLTEEEKKTYLASLPLSHLVELLFFCEKMCPNIPFYAPNTREILMEIRRAKEEAIMNENSVTEQLNGETFEPESILDDDSDLSDAADSNADADNLKDLPSYENMIIEALTAIHESRGVPPRIIYEWMESNYPTLNPRFRASASQALQKAVKKGKLQKDGSNYFLNTDYNGKFGTLPHIHQGLKLPPELRDSQNFPMDDNSEVFSHTVNPLPQQLIDNSQKQDITKILKESSNLMNKLENDIINISHTDTTNQSLQTTFPILNPKSNFSMSNLTEVFFEYSNKHSNNIPEIKTEKSIHKKNTEDPYIKEAYQIFKHINELKRFLINIRHAYLNIESRESTSFQSSAKHTSILSYKGFKTLSDRQREEIDAKSRIIIKQSRERILKLENFEKTDRKGVHKKTGLLSLFLQNSTESIKDELISKHRSGITWFLNKKLKDVSLIQEEQQRIKLLQQIEKNKRIINSANILSIQENQQAAENTIVFDLDTNLSKEQIQILETENNEMIEYFESTLDQVRSIQRSLSEISKIQTELASHIEEQSYITNKLHEEVLSTSELIKNGSTQLIQAKGKNKTSTRLITWFLLISSSILLLLDWYN